MDVKPIITFYKLCFWWYTHTWAHGHRPGQKYCPSFALWWQAIKVCLTVLLGGTKCVSRATINFCHSCKSGKCHSFCKTVEQNPHIIEELLAQLRHRKLSLHRKTEDASSKICQTSSYVCMKKSVNEKIYRCLIHNSRWQSLPLPTNAKAHVTKRVCEKHNVPILLCLLPTNRTTPHKQSATSVCVGT